MSINTPTKDFTPGTDTPMRTKGCTACTDTHTRIRRRALPGELF
ncbi:MAG TPA: hypothetical protein VJP87_01495 [Candidatus Acidoferrales bacterium]|nr:hypothetical protein [Candidatus Acidoferrales bacterium]